MKKFCNFIVEKGKWFLALFLVLTIVFGVLIFFCNINYDMTDYLPKDSETFEAMDTMFDEFGDGGSASIMISDINMKDVSAIRKEMSLVKGVRQVLWIDSALIEYYPNIKDMEITFGETTLTIGEMFKTPEAFADFILNNYESLIGTSLIPEDMMGMVDMMMGQFYKEGNALVQIFFEENAYSKVTVHAIDELKAIVENAGYEQALGGMAASAYAMETIMESELFKLVLILAPIIIGLLFMFTTSYFEPVAYIVVIGISVILNMGSNIMMSSVSYLTFSIAALIQVAVSMDYSIFIMHRYKEYRHLGYDKKSAAKEALYKSLTSVSASSLTTIAGFVALVFMRYTIGADIGLVLAKGVLMSLITAFLFMPGFLVLCDKPIMKGEHKPIWQAISDCYVKSKAKRLRKRRAKELGYYENTDKIVRELKAEKSKKKEQKGGKTSRNLLRLRFVLPVLFIAVLAPAFFAQSGNHFMYGELASSGGDGSTLMIDRANIESEFGSQNSVVVLLNKKHEDKELEIANELMKVDKVLAAQCMSVIENALNGMPIPQFMENQFIGKNDYRMIVLAVDTGEEDEAAFKAVDDVRAVMKTQLDDGYYLIGNSVVAEELKAINNKDYTITTSLALLFIFIILLITFKGLVLPLILALLIQGSIWIAMTIPYFANMPIVFLGYLIVSCFQMGCTIDYGILFSNNYLRNRETEDKFTSVKLAFKSSVGAISLSAAILMTVGYVVGIAGSIPATSNIGLLLGIGATVSYFVMTFLLPLFLVLFDKPIRKTTIRFKKKEKQAD
ncbi:MAG: MMPL family transporter [Clostridia bacterium]|nr:MMPL family transporter [Clostridia bacterium]MDY5264003.1 MMPL family transporter [Eubacteriales bacterium]MDY5439348.1 MMPL family transporter [Eubacteriales bacterium]